MSTIPIVYMCIISTIIAIIIIAIILPVIGIYIWAAYKRDKEFAKKNNMSVAEFLSSRQTRSKTDRHPANHEEIDRADF